MGALIWLIVLLAILGPLLSALQLEATVTERDAIFDVRWLLLTVGVDTRAREFRLSLLRRTVLRRPFGGADEPEEKEEPEKPGRTRRPGRKLSPARLIAERRALLALARYLWRHLHWPRFRVRLTVATPDPALTGELFGLLSALGGALSGFVPEGALRVAADFAAESPRGRAEMALRVRIYVLVVVLVRALLLYRRVTSKVRGAPSPRPWNAAVAAVATASRHPD